MKSIAIFNNKGGVGKSTLAFNLSHALALQGYKTLMIDLDPQANLTLNAISSDTLEKIWLEEEPFIEDFKAALEEKNITCEEYFQQPRTIHSLLKPIEDGIFGETLIGTPIKLNDNLGLIPGRLSVHSYENALSKRWNDAFMGDVAALRFITAIYNLCIDAEAKYGYEYIIIDTSPSLGMLNKVIISTSSAFFVPCMPDMFSLYGIKNIGQALKMWSHEFTMLSNLLSDTKKKSLPKSFVKFLGYTLYNAKKYSSTNKWNLAQAHFDYAEKLPIVIKENIPESTYHFLKDKDQTIIEPIGGEAVMHSHNTLPSVSQKYNLPIWELPSSNLDKLSEQDKNMIQLNKKSYEETRNGYMEFSKDLINRLSCLDME